MARITVEDCIDKFPSRFELVLVASNRARKLHSGEIPTVEIDNDKNTVIALREIADETLSIDKLKDDLVEEYQTATLSEDDEIYESSDLDENEEIEHNTLIENTSIKTEEENQLNITEEENQLNINEEENSDQLDSNDNNSELSNESE